MQRNLIMLLILVAVMAVSTAGCRSCANCHDYDPPVAGCDCHAYGTQRAGSASGGYVGGYIEEPYYEIDSDVAEPGNVMQTRRPVAPR